MKVKYDPYLDGDVSKKDLFKAGQQSRQAEIDELKAKKEFRDLSQDIAIKNIKTNYEKQISGLAKTITKMDVEIDELQKRIDEALVLCEKGCMLKAMSILKGTNQD